MRDLILVCAIVLQKSGQLGAVYEKRRPNPGDCKFVFIHPDGDTISGQEASMVIRIARETYGVMCVPELVKSNPGDQRKSLANMAISYFGL